MLSITKISIDMGGKQMNRQIDLKSAAVSIGLLATCAIGVGVSRAADTCTPGTTKKIAFMLKQQTAFRYLHADVPFFKKTVEEAGYQVLVQSAENDAQNQVAQAEN